MKKIIIIGGAGYIGTVLIDYLIKRKNLIYCLDNNLYNHKDSIASYHRNKKFSYLNFDIRNFKKIDKIIDKNTSIVLLAGLVGDPISKKYPRLSKSINESGISKFLDHIKHKSFDRLIFVSTCSNYGLSRSKKLLNEKSKLNPISSYAKAKVKIEKKLLNFKKVDFSKSILRFATAFGLSKRMRFDLTINEFIENLFNKSKLEVYDYNTFRPYCHTKDFARAIIKILISKNNIIDNQVYNIGNSKQNYSKKSIALRVKKFIKKDVKIIFTRKSNDKRNYKVDFSKIRKELNFKTKYDVDYGIKEILKFIKKNKQKEFSSMGNYKISKN